MAIKAPAWRLRLLVMAAVVLSLAVIFGSGRVSTASAGYPCNTHYAAPANCVNGSGYCLGVSSSNWILTDSGWISRTLAYITS